MEFYKMNMKNNFSKKNYNKLGDKFEEYNNFYQKKIDQLKKEISYNLTKSSAQPYVNFPNITKDASLIDFKNQNSKSKNKGNKRFQKNLDSYAYILNSKNIQKSMRARAYRQAHHSVSPKKPVKHLKDSKVKPDSFCFDSKDQASSVNLKKMKREENLEEINHLNSEGLNFPKSIENIIKKHDQEKTKMLEKYKGKGLRQPMNYYTSKNLHSAGFQVKHRVNSRHYSHNKNACKPSDNASLSDKNISIENSQKNAITKVSTAKKCESLRKSPNKVVIDKNNISDFVRECKSSSPNRSVYIKSGGAENLVKENQRNNLKLVKIPQKLESDLTLPNITKTQADNSESIRHLASGGIPESSKIDNPNRERNLSMIKKKFSKDLDSKINKQDCYYLPKPRRKSLSKFRVERKSQPHYRASPTRIRRFKSPAFKKSQIKLKDYFKNNSKKDILNLTAVEGPDERDTSIAKEENKGSAKGVHKYEDFEQIATISRGSFGIIELVKHIRTQKPFVFKKIPQIKLMKDKQIEHLKNEKKICLNKEISRDFLIQCYDTFQNTEDLYFVMEFLPGGDLHDLTKNVAFASLEKVRFYFSEVILAIEELHKHNIVHRDIKLDNILIASDGHVKLIDFGFAKQLQDDTSKTKTKCGTINYLSPEVIRGVGSDLRSDIWSLGVLLCEMIGGFSPFRSPDPQTLYENILKLNITWPRNIDKISKDLISQMLVCEPEMRLPLTSIKEHLFFKNIDWEALSNRKVSPPFVPDLEDEFSLEYFKNDKKLEIYKNPLYEFDQKAGLSTKECASPEFEKKFSNF
ncbi:unnamed protein product [Moneuplotes crassus]|uniref:Uncharacterized protein n=1 Tax=Euplotes crassus TaxID=5936 RepID=A0AAD1XXB2_EUPCR|nr:unnamed protein product [Moneuplotes crassus]